MLQYNCRLVSEAENRNDNESMKHLAEKEKDNQVSKHGCVYLSTITKVLVKLCIQALFTFTSNVG